MAVQLKTPTFNYDSIVIGGGFFGSEIALSLADKGERVLLVEKESRLMQRASAINQARVHNGYHYPRSILTALRSRVSFPRFVKDYSAAIDHEFEQYYGVAKAYSNVSARQYLRFCERIGASIKPAPEQVKALFNDTMIEDVFLVREATFDAAKLRKLVEQKLAKSQVTIRRSTEVSALQRRPMGTEVTLRGTTGERTLLAREVYNCTYSNINVLHATSNLPPVSLKHELTEVALIEPPAELEGRGVTVMCGPFFSTMPFPTTKFHSLTHVRYTPHREWHDSVDEPYTDAANYLHRPPSTAFPKMIADARRYLPVMENAQYRKSLWEIKTVLPQSEGDDSRPILYRTFPELPGYTSVLGGKIDNIYDVITELESKHAKA